MGKNLPIWSNLEIGEMDTKMEKYLLAIDKSGTGGYQTPTRGREGGLIGLVLNYASRSFSLRSLHEPRDERRNRKVPLVGGVASQN
jgi:hypothetical protein